MSVTSFDPLYIWLVGGCYVIWRRRALIGPLAALVQEEEAPFPVMSDWLTDSWHRQTRCFRYLSGWNCPLFSGQDLKRVPAKRSAGERRKAEVKARGLSHTQPAWPATTITSSSCWSSGTAVRDAGDAGREAGRGEALWGFECLIFKLWCPTGCTWAQVWFNGQTSVFMSLCRCVMGWSGWSQQTGPRSTVHHSYFTIIYSVLEQKCIDLSDHRKHLMSHLMCLNVSALDNTISKQKINTLQSNHFT